MTGKELYEKYKGRQAKLYDSIGVICGYSDDCLIMAVTAGCEGWDAVDVIITHKNNPERYLYVDESDILPE